MTTTVRIIHWYRDPKADGWLFTEDTKVFDTPEEAEAWITEREKVRNKTFYEIDPPEELLH